MTRILFIALWTVWFAFVPLLISIVGMFAWRTLFPDPNAEFPFILGLLTFYVVVPLSGIVGFVLGIRGKLSGTEKAKELMSNAHLTPKFQNAHHSASAKRMNMNSRGCQPMDQRPKTNPTLKGSHYQPSQRAFRIRQTHHQSPSPLFGPFRADVLWLLVPWVSPTAIHVIRLRRTGIRARPFDVGCWMFPLSHV